MESGWSDIKSMGESEKKKTKIDIGREGERTMVVWYKINRQK